MNSELDAYTKQVIRFLEAAQPGQVFTIDKICKPWNRNRFIAAVKLYISSLDYGGGVEFTGDYKRIKKHDISMLHVKL